MAIPNQILELARENPVDAGVEVCKYALEWIEINAIDGQSWTESDHSVLLEAAALILHLEEDKLMSLPFFPPDVSGDMDTCCSKIATYLREVRGYLIGQSSEQKLERLKKQFSLTLTNGFGYEFTDGDLNRIQQLINELRDLVRNNTELEDAHKQRLLRRLEQMQSELHKKVSDLSRYYGMMGEAGVMLGKLGEGAKPFVDRVKELADIVWRSQARAEQLQSGTDNPMLGNDDKPRLLESE
ncbi:hypothetical protein [Pseudomonas monteilii]|uniref:hypothetical protein n=1 Tax=Pseudomonas monteilii TaxID=76759 RepID=UPI0008635BE1|nr:hypothetical protein [Pseudomonas monteilii]